MRGLSEKRVIFSNLNEGPKWPMFMCVQREEGEPQDKAGKGIARLSGIRKGKSQG